MLRFGCLWLCLFFLSACAALPGQTPTAVPIPTVGPTILPPGPSPTPLVCTPNPPGLSLQATLGAKEGIFQSIHLVGKGFDPNATVFMAIEGRGTNQSIRLETPNFRIKSDGSIDYFESLQADEPNMTWQVFIVHRRGIVCVTLP